MRRWAFGVLALGLLLRFAYAWYGHRAGHLPTAADGYESIAINLLERGEYAMEPGQPTSRREPSYPLFIAATYALAGQRPGVVIFLHCLLSAATGWLLWLTGRRLFDEKTALAALAVFCLYPQSIYYCAYFFRETWLCFLFGVLFWSCLDWAKSERAVLIGGLAAAALGLANSALLPACALAGLVLRGRKFLIYFAPLVLAFSAWSARNWSVQGRFVAGSTHGGSEFYQALIVPPEDLGTARQGEIVQASAEYARASALPSEGARNDAFMKESFRWIAANPGVFVSRAVAGVLKYWKLWPYKRTYQYPYGLLVLISLLSDAWIIPLGFYGLWLFRARWREAPAFPAALIAMTLVYGAVHAVIRYRLPLMGGMILLACAALKHLRQKVRLAR